MKKTLSLLLILVIVLFNSFAITTVSASNNLKVVDVYSGGFFNGALMDDNSLWVWGQSFYMGIQSEEAEYIPKKIMTDVIKASFGRAHILALKSDGDLYSFGLYGGIGLSDIVGEDYTLCTPTKILSDVKYMEAGGGESCAITNDGSLYIWYSDFKDNATTSPQKVLSDVRQATVGEGYWLAIKNDDTLWACGENNYGQLGDGTTEYREIPVKIMDNVEFVDTSYWGWSSTAAIKTDSTLWTWGLNKHGQLGNNGYYDKQVDVFDFRGELYDTYDVVTSPKKILDNVKSVQSAPQYMCAVLENGNLYEWGALEWENHFKTPVYVMNNVAYAESANTNGIATKSDGTTWVWGWNMLSESGYDRCATPIECWIVKPIYPVYFSNSLTNQDRNVITYDNISEVTKVNITLSRLHTGEYTGVFLIAFYSSDNKLIYATSKSSTINESGNEVEIDIVEDVSSAYKVKAYAWKDLSSIEPMCKALEENIIIE